MFKRVSQELCYGIVSVVMRVECEVSFVRQFRFSEWRQERQYTKSV